MYLTKQGRYFYAVLEVPKDVRRTIGKTSFRKTLKTTDRWQAEQRARQYIEEWKEAIRVARLSPEEQLEHQTELLRQDWKELEKLKETAQTEAEFEEVNNFAHVLQEVTVDKILKKYKVQHSEQLTGETLKGANAFFDVVTGKTIRFSQYIEEHLQELKVELKTKDAKRQQILRFADRVKLTKNVNRDTVRDYIRFLSKEQELSNKTIKRDLTNLSVYWEYLRDDQRIVPRELANPFRNQKLPTENRKEAAKEMRLAFSLEDIRKLYEVLSVRVDQAAEADEDLLDVFLIAVYTGARREEIGGLRLKNFSKAGTIRIENAKTEAGNREVPIHPQLEAIIQRRICSLDDSDNVNDSFIFPNLSTAKYGKRTDALGKRFGRIKASLGYDKRYVFHSIRKTVTTLMEQAGVAEGVAADILGHDKPSITYGLYSGGTSIEQKYDAITTLSYGLT